MAEDLYTGFGNQKILAERAKKDINGNSLELTISDNKITQIGGKTISGNVEIDAYTKEESDNKFMKVALLHAATYSWNDCDYVSVGSDTRAYPTVQIGNLIWTTENIDYKWNGLHIATGNREYSGDTPYGSYYGNNESTYGVNGKKYGLLYNYPAAEYINSILTNGWRVATASDFSALFNSAVVNNDQSKLRTTTEWTTPGTNTSGFSALPCGLRAYSGSSGNMEYSSISTASFYRTIGDAYKYAYITLNGISASYATDARTQCSIRIVRNA
jgi:uncharacterized protein (TIGR02145 family)